MGPVSTTPPTADVCLILEGTYPYVKGGVSSWVHALIVGLPDVTFALLAVSSERATKAEVKYELPPNVVSFAEVFIHELIDDPGRRCPASEKHAAWQTMKDFHLTRGAERHTHAEALLAATADPKRQALSVHDAFYSEDAWKFVLDRYDAQAKGTSFIDYFWTWRAVHAPLFQTLIAEIPPARVYHAISTGYAGLLGVVAKLRTGRPLLLTEHGIYVRERAIDIARADWIYEEPQRVRVAKPGTNPLKETWINFFVTLGELTYRAADAIVTLFAGNERLQHELGADPARTRVIPNGVDPQHLAPLRKRRRPPGTRPRRVGFIGRVVPIKDVKTLIKACSIVAVRLPDAEFWIVGPTDEDPAYHRECEDLARSLGVTRLEFLGSRDIKTIFPDLDVMVLTSVSEGQPLTILEAACAGVPTVATDVGACRELIEGRLPEDVALGPSGVVTGVGDPVQTANAILKLLDDPAFHARAAAAGAERVDRYYRQAQVLASYRALYAPHVGRA